MSTPILVLIYNNFYGIVYLSLISRRERMKLYSPEGAAQWLTERLARPVSRESLQRYIATGDLAAQNSSSGSRRARWVILEADLEAFASRVKDGRLPQPTGGWPQYQGKPNVVKEV